VSRKAATDALPLSHAPCPEMRQRSMLNMLGVMTCGGAGREEEHTTRNRASVIAGAEAAVWTSTRQSRALCRSRRDHPSSAARHARHARHGTHLRVPALAVLCADEVLQAVVDARAVRHEEAGAGGQLVEEEELLLGAQHAVVALLGLLHHVLVRCKQQRGGRRGGGGRQRAMGRAGTSCINQAAEEQLAAAETKAFSPGRPC